MNSFEFLHMYNNIASDLNIKNFGGESPKDYHNRVIYSGIAKWIMQLFADRESEDTDINQVSKAHVTLSAMDLIESWKKIDSDIGSFIEDGKKFVNDVENIYTTLGYINSDDYIFTYPSYRTSINFNKNLSLDIDLDAENVIMIGLGSWKKKDDSGIDLNDFLITKTNEKSFINLLNILKFDNFIPSLGKIEVYDIKKNKWELFSERLTSEFEYYILKIDDGLDYQILRHSEDKYYVASLPSIYTKKNADKNFIHEVWRIILSLCKYNGFPAKCKITSYCEKGIQITFGGFILPFMEYSLFKCMCWPLNKANTINDFVTYKPMKSIVIQLLETLDIEIQE